MPSLHPRYPVLKVPAPARLAAAVAQGLIMPEGGPPGPGISVSTSRTQLGGFFAKLKSDPADLSERPRPYKSII